MRTEQLTYRGSSRKEGGATASRADYFRSESRKEGILSLRAEKSPTGQIRGHTGRKRRLPPCCNMGEPLGAKAHDRTYQSICIITEL